MSRERKLIYSLILQITLMRDLQFPFFLHESTDIFVDLRALVRRWNLMLLDRLIACSQKYHGYKPSVRY